MLDFSRDNMDEKPSKEKKIPNWISQLYECVYRHWNHHSPCKHINLKTDWSRDTKCWHITAAPVYQEILGGEKDGEKVWAGFLFDMGDFSRDEGVWIQEQAFMSLCSECTEIPKIMVKGKFRGHNFYLHLLLEPPKDSEIVEVIDTLKKEVREKIAVKDCDDK
jgi:hypothetical protein